MNAMLIALFTTLAVLLLYYIIIQPLEAVVQLESKFIPQQQNHSFIAKLTGNNVVPPVNTNAIGIAKFQAKHPNNNELYYGLNQSYKYT